MASVNEPNEIPTTNSMSSADPTAIPTGELTPGAALKYAWWAYLFFITAPFIVFVAMLYRYLVVTPGPDSPMANRWFLAAMAYLITFVPAAIFWRSHIFKPYYDGHPVAPRGYLKGMMIVWGSLCLGGVLALTGCLVTRTLAPGIAPAIIAFVLFLPFWPSGRTMVKTVGSSDDPQRYEEPR